MAGCVFVKLRQFADAAAIAAWQQLAKLAELLQQVLHVSSTQPNL
jgi:hypothetical protein